MPSVMQTGFSHGIKWTIYWITPKSWLEQNVFAVLHVLKTSLKQYKSYKLHVWVGPLFSELYIHVYAHIDKNSDIEKHYLLHWMPVSRQMWEGRTHSKDEYWSFSWLDVKAFQIYEPTVHVVWALALTDCQMSMTVSIININIPDYIHASFDSINMHTITCIDNWYVLTLQWVNVEIATSVW